MRPACLPRPRGHALRLMVAALVCLAAPPPAGAFSGGITTEFFNPNTSGCNACHSGGTNPRVTLTGPSSVPAGSTSTFELRIDPSGATQSFGGLNASAPAGILAVGGPNSEGTEDRVGTGGRAEITHTSRKVTTAGAVLFSFLWTAPDVPGTVSLRLWGNAVDGNGLSSRDRAATVLFPIEVLAAEATPTGTPTPTEPAAPTETPTEAPTPAPTATPTPTSPAPPPCPGDCNGDTEVTVDEILIGVNIAQGAQVLDACPAFDANGDEQVAIDDILAAVTAALNGCPA